MYVGYGFRVLADVVFLVVATLSCRAKTFNTAGITRLLHRKQNDLRKLWALAYFALSIGFPASRSNWAFRLTITPACFPIRQPISETAKY